MAVLKSAGLERIGVMSLKMMPGFGKSGTSRMAERRDGKFSESIVFALSQSEQRAATKSVRKAQRATVGGGK